MHWRSEWGDFLGDDGGRKGLGVDQSAGQQAKAKLRSLMKKRLVRDPELYEFSEYLP